LFAALTKAEAGATLEEVLAEDKSKKVQVAADKKRHWKIREKSGLLPKRL